MAKPLDFTLTGRDEASAAFLRVRDAAATAAARTQLDILRAAAHPDNEDEDT